MAASSERAWGKWIAWSSDGLRIIAHADTLDECEAAAAAIGDTDPSFEKVPHSHVRIVGLGRREANVTLFNNCLQCP